MTTADTEKMTLGMWIDYVIEYNNQKAEQEKEQGNGGSRERQATQADFDSF